MAGIKQIVGSAAGVPQDRWLIKQIDSQLGNTQPPQRSDVFYPSLLGNTCDRYLYIAYNGMAPEQDITAQTQRIFDNGGYLEDRMDKYFTDLEIVIDRERVVKLDTPPISGRVDFIIEHGQHGETALELKSINARGFGALNKGPKAEHEIQLQIYLNLLPMEYGIVLYENKNDQKLKSFLIQKDISVWQGLLDRCYRIMQMTSAPKECTGNRWCRCKGVDV